MTDVDRAIAEIVARQAIVDVTVRYGTALDTRDWELLASLFTPDAVADFGPWGEADGPDAIVAAARPVMEGMDATQHVVVNHVVELEASLERAACTCVLVAEHLLATTSGASTSTTRGRYLDRFVLRDGTWLIEHRVLEVTWREGNTGIFGEAVGRAGTG